MASDITEYLRQTIALGGSDLHLSAWAPACARVNGSIVPFDQELLDPAVVRDLILDTLTEAQRSTLEQEWELDYALQVEGVGRFRGNVHIARGHAEAAFRFISQDIPPLETLGHHAIVHEFCNLRSGLILVTGITGSGKSTTLASLIDWARRNHPKHIVTVEDPIEYQYPDDMDDPDYPGHRIPSPSIVTQQEVGRDVHSYRQGLKDVLRKAPHIILLGEIRDREAMETCMEAAQTGHLVLSTLHTTGAVKTIGRILELYPKDNHTAVLSRLAEILIFIHSQGLLNGVEKRVLTYEFLQNNDDAVSSAIANYDGGARSLEDVIRRAGNIEWDNNLKRLLNQGLITQDTFQNVKMNKNDDGE